MLDINALHKVRASGNRVVSQCPACHVIGKDRSSNHLVYYVDSEAFSCIAHPNDSAHLSEIFSIVGIKKEFTAQDKAERKALSEKLAQERRAKEIEKLQAPRRTQALEDSLASRLAPYLSDSWRVDFLDSSPMNFDSPSDIRHDFIKSLFHADQVIWMGESRHESGSPRHKANFKTCKEWLKLPRLPQLIAPGTFTAGVQSKASENVLTKPFLIIECDELVGFKPESLNDRERNKQLSHALIRYVENELGLTLRAAIETGGKSIHAWFDRPSDEAVNALLAMADGLRIDKGPIDQGHYPLRAHGCQYKATNNHSQILFLNPITQ